jgi:hypothetical protein
VIELSIYVGYVDGFMIDVNDYQQHSTIILFLGDLTIECQGINTILIFHWEKGKHGSISEELHVTWCACAADHNDDGRPWWPNYNSKLCKDHMPRSYL